MKSILFVGLAAITACAATGKGWQAYGNPGVESRSEPVDPATTEDPTEPLTKSLNHDPAQPQGVAAGDASAPQPRRPIFDATKANAALHHISLAPCMARGVPRGTVQAVVTFAPTGRVSRAIMQAPVLGADATSCVIDRIGRAAPIDPFDGDEVDVTMTWSVP